LHLVKDVEKNMKGKLSFLDCVILVAGKLIILRIGRGRRRDYEIIILFNIIIIPFHINSNQSKKLIINGCMNSSFYS
jgi:hypothetical protein